MPILRYSSHSRRLLSTFYYYIDDFVGSLYNDRWWSGRGTGGNITVVADSLIRVRATANQAYELYQGDSGDFTAAKNAKSTWRFRLSSLTNMSGEVGFMAAAPSSSTDWICVLYDSTKGANWYIQSATVGGGTTEQNTGVAANTSYHEATIECTSSSIRFYLDGALLGTINTNITTLTLQLYVYVTSKTGSARDVFVDWVEATGDRE